jgi:hypothetical protein
MSVEPECLVKARILDYFSLGNYASAGIPLPKNVLFCFVSFRFVSFETPIDLAGKRSVSA